MTLLAIFLGLFFVYSLASGRLQQTVVTAPMLFTAAGALVSRELFGRVPTTGGTVTLLWTAEVGLVLLLFADASRTDLRSLKSLANLPARLLSVGMLLTLGLGMVAARLVLPGLTWWEAGILSAILAPTDAGLGQVIVTSPRVPVAVRQALNVEAGLNDGLSVPFLMFFIVLAGLENHEANLAKLIVEQLVYGAGLGAVIGLGGGALLHHAHRARWTAPAFHQLGVVALPLLCLPLSEAAGASMFIAAFTAGLTVQVTFPDAGRHSIEFTEEWGQLINLAVFFLFGLLVARDLALFTWAMAVYALLSLTLVRMLPVWVSLLGTGLRLPTVLFMGWFGPRGLASIVLGLVYLEQETRQAGEQTIRLAVMVTVFLSIFAHGLTAQPGIGWLSRFEPAKEPAIANRKG
ncbi:MAG: cation:proton antiporter [Verrucomicrobiota bacterium]